MEDYKTLLNKLVEAIDYSYLNPDGTYNDLAMPVVDKVNYVKKCLRAVEEQKVESDLRDAKFLQEFPYTFDDLANNDVRVGDIVAYKLDATTNIITYALLRKGFPEQFNTSLCCTKRENDNELHLTEIGFTYLGKPLCKFRKATASEVARFTMACIKALKEPIQTFGWQEEHYAQILGNMLRDGLISRYRAIDINKELKKIHKIDFLSKYKKHYGDI